MKVTQKKDNFNDIMSIASLCGYIVFSLFRIFTENNKLMLIPFFLVVSTILILMEVGIRKFIFKKDDLIISNTWYFSQLVVNIFLATIIYIFYIKVLI